MEREYGSDNVVAANTLNNLALTQRLSGQVEEAIATHRRVLWIREAALDPGHPDIAETLNNLGVAYMDVDLDSAPAMLQRAQIHVHVCDARSEEHTSELQSREKLVCRLLLEKKNSCNF